MSHGSRLAPPQEEADAAGKPRLAFAARGRADHRETYLRPQA